MIACFYSIVKKIPGELAWRSLGANVAIQVECLGPENLSPFVSLIPHAWRQSLTNVPPDPSFRGTVVRALSQPIGFALGQILRPDPNFKENETTGHLLSVFVEAPFRQRGVATALLEGLFASMRSEGATKLSWVHEERQGNIIALDRILDRFQWSQRAPYSWYASCSKPETISRLLEQPWIRAPLPSGISLASVSEMPPEEQVRMEQRAQDNPFALELSPSGLEMNIDQKISTVALSGDRLVGWQIISTSTNGFRLYSSLFVEPEFRNTGLGPALLGEVIRRHTDLDRNLPKVGGYWEMLEDSSAMARLFKRRLKGLCDSSFQRFIRLHEKS